MLNKTFVLLEFQLDSNDNDIARTKQIQDGNKSMIAIVLAGGYAKRLQSITKDIPKPLLKVAGKPIISYIFDRINRIEDIQRIIISTNLRFEEQFKEWLSSNPSRTAEIISDRSHSDEEKPGALASLASITADMDEDCLIIAGDNLFTSSLRSMIQQFKARRFPTIALHDIKDEELAKQYSTVMLDKEGRITNFVEKPKKPKTTFIGTCIYTLPKQTLPRLRECTRRSDHCDNTGKFIEWLHKREPVYGHILEGHWWDIGTPDQYLIADQTLRDSTFREKHFERALNSSVPSG